MPGPPTDIPASELWSLITATPRPHRAVAFPRKDIAGLPLGDVAMVVLTLEEQQICAAEAERYAKAILKEAAGQTAGTGYQAIYENEASIQLLYRACRDVNNLEKHAFPSPGLMRKHLTGDELAVLLRAYLMTQSELGPIVAHFEPDEQEAWIRRLAEGGEAFPTASLSPAHLERLLISMASQLVSFWTDTASPGSPPEESPSGLVDETPDVPND